MAIKSRHCSTCNNKTRHEKPAKSISFVAGALLTLLTAGLFLVIWIPVSLAHDLQPYHCVFCGSTNSAFKKSETTIAVRILCLAVIVLVVILFSHYG